jgi:hypothetical protein
VVVRKCSFRETRLDVKTRPRKVWSGHVSEIINHCNTLICENGFYGGPFEFLNLCESLARKADSGFLEFFINNLVEIEDIKTHPSLVVQLVQHSKK